MHAKGARAQEDQAPREIKALRSFGFLAGDADDGDALLAARQDVQRFLGQDPNGTLTQSQKQVLFKAHSHYIRGFALHFPKMMAKAGPRALLLAVMDNSYPVQFGDPAFSRTAVRPGPPPNARAPVRTAGFCAMVGAAEDGTPSRIEDFDTAQAFCAGRAAAIADAQRLLAQAGMSETEVLEHCASVARSMGRVRADVATRPAAEVIPTLPPLLARFGLTDIEQAGGYGTLCLGLGYGSGNDYSALAGALLSVAAGETGPARLIGQHLALGLGGLPKRGALADHWTALDGG